MGSRKNEGVECRKFEHGPRRAQQKPSRRGKRDMQALLPLHLVTAGVGIAWVVRLAVNSIQKPKRAPEPGEVAGDGSADADLERSATQWLARNGFEHTSGTPSPSFTEHVSSLKSSYAELELLTEGDFVYIRSGGSVLTALVPTVRQLTLQPLQLAKGKPDAVPTAPLEAISVWLVRRCKQEVVFELLGPHDRRHILEADLNTPHGVALADGSRGKRGRWLITSQGLASVKWPSHVLSLQLVNVQLLDARAVKSVRDVFGYKLAEARSKLRQEETARTQAEVERVKMEAELKRVRNETASRVAEVRAQLDAAVLARHAAEREVAALQGQKAEEAARAKAALARVSKVEFEAQQAEGTVRRQHQQIQGMLAVQAEELRTLQQELQIAREANEGLKRAMHEKMMSLQGALELRDARILELEEENDRMDTVLQVIQAQLGAGNLAFSPEQRSSGGGDLFSEQLGVVAAVVNRVRAGSVGSAGSAGSSAELYREPAAEPSLSSIVGTLTQPQQSAGGQSLDGQPLWRSLLDLTGDLSVTALKESLAISRRNTVEDVPTLSVSCGHHWQSPFVTGEADSAAPPGSGGVGGTLSGVQASVPTSGAARRSSGVGGATDEMRAASGNWGSDGGSGDAGVAAEYTFVSAAVRMSGHLALASGGSTASPLRQQQPQVPGAAGGGGVGFQGVVQTHPSGTGADAAARRGSYGGRQDGGGLGSARNRSNGSARVSGAVSARSGAAVAASGCSPAQLEYGLEATLTLDSLRRRMRQLEAERERLELLRVSLEESLPWRTGVGAGDSSCVSYLAALLQEPSGVGVGAAVVAGDGVAFVSAEDGHLHLKQVIQKSTDHLKQAEVQGATTRQHQFGVDEIRGGEVQPPGGLKGQAVACAMYHEEQQSQSSIQQHSEAHQVQFPGVGPGLVHEGGAAGNLVAQQQRRTDSGSSTRSPVPSSRYPCANESDHGSSPCCAMRATPPLASPSYGIRELQQGKGRPGSKASPWELATGGAASAGLPRGLGLPVDEAACNRLEEEDSLSSSCCSSNGHSGNSATSKYAGAEDAGCIEAVIPAGEAWLQLDPAGLTMSPASSASAPPDADPVFTRPCTVTVAVDAGTSPADSRFTEGAITGVVCMPLEGGCYNAVGPAGMLLPGLRIDGNTSQPGGFYDSIDGLCNLGSTRGMPTARGAGWQTARRVVHSRQPSAGVAIDVLPLTVADGAPSPGLALKLPPRACSPAPLDSHRHCGAVPLTADVTPRGAWTGAGIPKSCGSTPCAGEFGADEDGLVLCDEQVTISPPPAMLLSPLDKLRGAAAAAVAVVATTTGPDGGLSRAGERLLSALGEDDEEY